MATEPYYGVHAYNSTTYQSMAGSPIPPLERTTWFKVGYARDKVPYAIEYNN